mmetsp:Transcript_24591/g.63490  ORF Transcript_24591/g.63490 Transcript_24591/m.63490 type:complete len:275 (-) Transcript_24591:297-1121(-)
MHGEAFRIAWVNGRVTTVVPVTKLVRLIVGEGLDDLLARRHHERAVLHDWLADWLALQEQQLDRAVARRLEADSHTAAQLYARMVLEHFPVHAQLRPLEVEELAPCAVAAARRRERVIGTWLHSQGDDGNVRSLALAGVRSGGRLGHFTIRLHAKEPLPRDDSECGCRVAAIRVDDCCWNVLVPEHLEMRVPHLVGTLEVEPDLEQLEAVRPVPLKKREHLRVRDAFACSHPLHIASLAKAALRAERVAVINNAMSHKGDGLEPAVRVLWKPWH